MRRLTTTMPATALAAAFLLLAPAAALAQTAGPPRTTGSGGSTAAPRKGDMAVSGSLGFADATDNNFDGLEAIFDGTFEYHTSDRISWRGMIGGTSFDADINGRTSSVDITFLDANIVYGWHSDNLRPYVTGGVGIYSRDQSGPFFTDNGDVEVGLNGGGGVDIYLNRHWGIEVEGLFHGFSGNDPNFFFAATGGVKYRF